MFWIDAGSSFDAYGLGRTARALGIEPRRVLSRIRIARPFNVFQLESMVCRSLPRLWRGEPIVLSDPLIPFIDEDLPAAEVRRILPRVLEGIRRLKAVWLVLMVRREVPKGREWVPAALAREARSVSHLEEDEGRWRLRAGAGALAK